MESRMYSFVGLWSLTVLSVGLVTVGGEILACSVGPPCRCTERLINESKTIRLINVTCNDQSIKRFPKIMWKTRPKNVQIERFTMSHNKLRQIVEKQWFKILRPKVIDLSYNNIAFIEPESFSGLENCLEELNLAQNRKLIFDKSILKSLHSLNALDISNTATQLNGDDIFPMSNKLETLRMSSNGIVEISDRICSELVNLKVFDLSNNLLSQVPGNIKHCNQLERLDLHSNDITSLDDDFFLAIPRLKWLSLRDNGRIFFSDKSFTGLGDSLTHLYLSNLSQNGLPHHALSILQLLKVLHISDISIKYIQDVDFKGLSSLEELTICDNAVELKLEDESFNSVQNTLKKLSLARNNLKAVPIKAIQGLKNLKELDLSGNSITKISSSDFKGLVSLTILNLSINKLVTVDDDAFKYISRSLNVMYLRNVTFQSIPASLSVLSSLRQIDVSYNNFGRIEKYFFDGIVAQQISMRRCNITYMASLSFVRLYNRSKKKIVLDVSDNKLEKLHFITNATIFSKVNITNNILDCACHELAIFNCLRDKIKGSCTQPNSVKGEKLGSKTFKNEMLKVCNGSLPDHKHCTKPEGCDPKKDSTCANNVNNNSKGTVEIMSIVLGIVVFLNI